jgi:RNA polymerase sigma factor (sigma-70 family)
MSEAAAAAGIGRLLSDERLTRRAVEGDQRAFAAIFRRYHQDLYRFCLTLVGNPHDAQEALQNTMAKVLRALPGEERKIELKPWLYRIAHNESIDLLRRRREVSELDVEQVAPGYGLAEDVATRERLRQLLDDLRELPERQREVLVMRELSGLGFEEIGGALGTSGPVARQTLYEARQSLRQMDEGREMGCSEVTRALSDGDGRVARRRDVRAHLRSCAGCRRFREEMKSRQHDLAALAPLPALTTAGMLQGLLGGSHGASGGGLAAALGGSAAKSIGASAAAKGIATVAVVAALGVTAADKSGVIHLGLPGDRAAKTSGAGPSTSGSGAPGNSASGQANAAAAAAAGSGGGGAGASADGDAGGRGTSAGSPGRGHASANRHSRGHANGAATTTPLTHPHGQGHEKQHPAAAAHGQETAAAHQPPPHESNAGGKGNGGGEGNGDAPAGQAESPPAESEGHGQGGSPPGQEKQNLPTEPEATGQAGSPPGQEKQSPTAGSEEGA